ncbi:MAG: MOSC domain-containing protein [Actinomycetota bacterium]
MPIVARLNVTPVKSTALLHPEQIRLEPHGAVGNRDFFVVDKDGKRFSGAKKAQLLRIGSDYDFERDRLVLRLPGGVVAAGSAAANGEALSVRFYGRDVQGHVVEGGFEEALTRYTGEPVRLVRVDHPGTGVDVRPVTIVSLASVDELSRWGGVESRVDPGRFRMLLEIDGCAPHEEDTWSGRRVRIGGATVEVGRQVPRCATTTLSPTTGLRDFPTLSVIRKYRGVTADNNLPFGVYADVVEPGMVRVGDIVEPTT